MAKQDGELIETETEEGMSDTEKEANLLRSAENHEIELEEDETEGKGEEDNKPEEDKVDEKPDTPEEPAEPQEETVEVGGYKIPVKAAQALVDELQKGDDEEPEAEKESQALDAKRSEIAALVEKVKKAAVGDPAIEGLVELIGKLQDDLATKEQREAEALQAQEQTESDRQVFMSDRAEVEKAIGKELTLDQLKILVKTAAAVKVNRLQLAYNQLYGKKTPDQAAKPRYDTVDSRKQEKSGIDGLDEDFVNKVIENGKKFGIDPKRSMANLRKQYGG